MQNLCKEARLSPSSFPFPFQSHSATRNVQDEWCVHQVKLNYISFWNEEQHSMDIGYGWVVDVYCVHVHVVCLCQSLHSIFFFFSFPFFSIFHFLFLPFISMVPINSFFHAPSPFFLHNFHWLSWTDMEMNEDARRETHFKNVKCDREKSCRRSLYSFRFKHWIVVALSSLQCGNALYIMRHSIHHTLDLHYSQYIKNVYTWFGSNTLWTPIHRHFSPDQTDAPPMQRITNA